MTVIFVILTALFYVFAINYKKYYLKKILTEENYEIYSKDNIQFKNKI